MENKDTLPPLHHFKLSEFACKCGCGGLPQPALMTLVDQIRQDFGHPVVVSSGFRCPDHNKAIGGAKRSRHVVGDACDLRHTPELLAFILDRMGHYQICVEDPEVTAKGGWIHIDCLKRGNWRVFRP